LDDPIGDVDELDVAPVPLNVGPNVVEDLLHSRAEVGLFRLDLLSLDLLAHLTAPRPVTFEA
jgi:hypothetical protein